MNDQPDAVPELLAKREKELLKEWLEEQLKATTLRPEFMDESELRRQSAEFLKLLRETTMEGTPSSLEAPQCRKLTDMLGNITRSRVSAGFQPGRGGNLRFLDKATAVPPDEQRVCFRAEASERTLVGDKQLSRQTGALPQQTFTRRFARI